MKFRIENISRVDCFWTVTCKDMQGKKDKEEKKEEKAAFDIFPKDGKLAPGKKLTLTTTKTRLMSKKPAPNTTPSSLALNKQASS
jgi:hypothetical protein